MLCLSGVKQKFINKKNVFVFLQNHKFCTLGFHNCGSIIWFTISEHLTIFFFCSTIYLLKLKLKYLIGILFVICIFIELYSKMY